LVIDATDFMAKRDESFTRTLQDFAKVSADKGDLHVVFVTSEEFTMPLMTISSAVERWEVFEVEDMSDNDAVDYLKRRGVPEGRAVPAVKSITGGRIVRLDSYAIADSENPNMVDVYRAPRDTATGTTLGRLALKKDHKLFKTLLKEGRVGTSAAIALLVAADPYPETQPEDKEERAKKKIQELIYKDVLSTHPDNTCTFHSRAVETFFRSD